MNFSTTTTVTGMETPHTLDSVDDGGYNWLICFLGEYSELGYPVAHTNILSMYH